MFTKGYLLTVMLYFQVQILHLKFSFWFVHLLLWGS